ncbi:MAG: carboxypeptidase regulatory-like domain-containing protein, partial [Candidatus Eremiobacteraeota bacterium]|nr:carboxypeptidase regulatory-like domain-containing protein [Candidatus Eremiobacteraeota bacterium]
MILPMRVVASTIAFFIAVALVPPGARAQIAATSVDRVAHIQGKITDSRGQPIAGAVITANASAETWTASGADGTFLMKLPPGSYDILARKGGYTPAELTLTVNDSLQAKTIALAMREANLNSLSVGNAT